MAKLIDITGQKFGRLTVIKRVEDSVAKSGKRQPQWLCQCDCGGMAVCQAGNLKSGKSCSCGCYWKEKHSEKTVTDLVGRKFGRLTVVERANDLPSGKHKAVAWRCKCDCGNEKIVRACNLINGNTTSCGCYAKEMSHNTNFVDHSFEKINYLTIMPFYFRRDFASSQITYWMCECVCGNITFAQYSSLTSENILSCGCIGSSNGEYQITQILKSNNKEFVKEYWFDDLRTKLGEPMRFDFAIFENNKLQYLIEYQGEQHYVDAGKFGKQQREITDPAKKQYCQDHHIKLYEIRYDQDVTSEMINVLQGNSVPSVS